MKHLCWSWDKAENRAEPRLGGRRRPTRRSPRLSDTSWSSARGEEFDLEAPRFAERAGPSTGRSHPGKRERHLAAWRFFYPGPVGLDPALNGRLIALDGPALGLLGAPAHRPEQSSDVIDVIANAVTALDHLGDPRTSPHIRGEARRPSPARTPFHQSSLRGATFPPRTSWREGPAWEAGPLRAWPASPPGRPSNKELSTAGRFVVLRRASERSRPADIRLGKARWLGAAAVQEPRDCRMVSCVPSGLEYRLLIMQESIMSRFDSIFLRSGKIQRLPKFHLSTE